MPPPDAPEEVHRDFHATAVGNIRFAVSSLDLDDPSKYCTKVGSAVPDFQSFKNGPPCKAEDILTDDKKYVLLKVLLPSAMKMLSDALKVNRVVGNLRAYGCGPYTVPPAHSTTGVPDADFIIYVSAVPTNGLAPLRGRNIMLEGIVSMDTGMLQRQWGQLEGRVAVPNTIFLGIKIGFPVEI
eukprot:Tbor_TRINITY_DN6064_c1_g2::TRINITY_DN6064_c1_g2_i4::g.10472::m.10472